MYEICHIKITYTIKNKQTNKKTFRISCLFVFVLFFVIWCWLICFGDI